MDEIRSTNTSNTQFSGQMYLNMETYKKNGQAIITPVWFAADQQDPRTLYIRTYAKTGKVKRLRNNPSVRVAPCDRSGVTLLGSWVEATTRILEGNQARKANRLLTRKYGLTKIVSDVYYGITAGRSVIIAIDTMAVNSTR